MTSAISLLSNSHVVRHSQIHRPGSSGTELRNCLRTIAHADQHGVCARTTAPPSTKASTAGRRGTHPAPQLCRGTSANKNNVPATSGTWLFQFRNRDSKSALHCVLIEYVAARRCFQLILIHLDTIHSLTTEIFVLGTPQLQFLNLLNPDELGGTSCIGMRSKTQQCRAGSAVRQDAAPGRKVSSRGFLKSQGKVVVKRPFLAQSNTINPLTTTLR